MPDVSVLITVFNCAKYIQSSVASALSQRGVDFEVVVVNDGSEDETGPILRNIRHPGLRIVETHRIGRPRALNLGIEHCRAPYIAILDADDIALPDRLLHSLSALRNRPRSVIVGSRFRTLIDAYGHPIGVEDVLPAEFDEILPALYSRIVPMFHSSVTILKSALIEIGGYDQDLLCAIDMDLYIRMACRYEMSNIDRRLALKRVHKDQYFAGANGLYTTGAGERSRQIVRERFAAMMQTRALR
jgi:glycosyltransferase involved in cell wall biosynthesis